VTRRAYVLGDPIGHSISPAIHNAAFQARGVDVKLAAWHVKPEELAAVVNSLRADDVLGATVTVPHKEAVPKLVDEVDEAVRVIGAANTIHNHAGHLWAGNTDAAGFARSVAEAGIEIGGARVVLLGAGGAARAVAEALLRGGAASLLVANRHLQRALRLKNQFAPRHPGAMIAAKALDALGPEDLRDCALLVNTTTVGMQGDQTPLPRGLLPRSGAVVDIIYNPPQTRLLREAGTAGLHTLNGLPMLVLQAAAAWEIWMGQPAPLEAMFAAAEGALSTRARTRARP
jgi:shikimate dehydrogenase